MPKNIIIFSDGTGQVGGIRPDQRLSNIYKMYRAMRPGPSSPIKPENQVCFYDAGLGAGEVGGFSFKKFRNILASALGTGIDDNVIDCYEKIISFYEPGDRILLFGFSRGAYTVRTVANVMNLCGIPTSMPGEKPVPRYGAPLRKIATDAVKYVYNHGNGKPRSASPYSENREELGKRFRKKYSSHVIDAQEDVQGNVQPNFIGVFDTVAALGHRGVRTIAFAVILTIAMLALLSYTQDWHKIWSITLGLTLLGCSYWYSKLILSNFKYFSSDPERKLKLYNPLDWLQILKFGHFAAWDQKNYDMRLDADVGFARHALAIDEQRKNFPRVKWAMKKDAILNSSKNPAWLKQVWFAGCHSDVGGSYPESESRLSDIALGWMIEEVMECVPEVEINHDMLVISPDSSGLQHKEVYMIDLGFLKVKWPEKLRVVDRFPLHPSVLERLEHSIVPQLDETKPYRPKQLKTHPKANNYY